jgi:hypothetical protein
VFQLAETFGSLAFLAYVASQGSAIWTALVSVFVAGLILSNAVAYVGICDAPPPRKRHAFRRAMA